MCTVVVVVIAAAYWLLGDHGVLVLAVVAGPGLILLSHFMERRAKRAQKETDEQI